MCGRYVRYMNRAELEEYYRVLVGPLEPLAASYNVSPYQWGDVVRRGPDGRRELARMRWAIIPPWEPKASTAYSTINSRGEDVLQRRAFAAPFRKGQRILVPASGFYEWLKTDESVPFYIHPTGEPWFTFAGIWSRWEPPEGTDPDDPKLQPIDTFAIMTARANRFMSQVHVRMPVRLAPDQWDAWLDPATDLATLQSLIMPREWTDCEVYEVSADVNKTKNNHPGVIEKAIPTTALLPRHVVTDEEDAAALAAKKPKKPRTPRVG